MLKDELTAAARRMTFHDVLLLRQGPGIALCRIGAKQVWVPKSLLPPELRGVGDFGSLVIEDGLASALGLVP